MTKRLSIAVLGILVGGCNTLGASCESDDDCSSGLTCLSPGCVGELVCAYSCGATEECESQAGAGSECITEDIFDSCIGYCSAAD